MKYYVYAYLRNKDSDTAKAGTPYYIGKGKGRRAWDRHRGTKVPSDKSRIVMLETGLTEIGALALERRMIAWWGRKDLGAGILFNKTDGGDGATGSRPWAKGVPKTEEHKTKISKTLTGKPAPKSKYVKSENYRPGGLGIKHTPEQKALSSINSTGERNGNAKLTALQVIEIRKELAQNILAEDISAKYKISMSTVKAIHHRRIWKHLI